MRLADDPHSHTGDRSMEARLAHAVLLTAALLSLGASARTENFIVTASSPELAREAAQTAERYRRDLAIAWLGRELPAWSEPCPVTINEGAHLGAGGATSFMFDRGRPHGWTMTIQGPRDRVLDSVLPHEVTHTILATHFGRPLPRWADEGASTTVEHDSERAKQHQMLIQFLTTGRGIAFNRMFAMTEYPKDIMPLYAQGYSLSRFLIEQGGRQRFVEYLGDGMSGNNWTAATSKHYGFGSLSELQVTWLEWVRQGSPPLQERTEFVAVADDSANAAGSSAQQPEQPFAVASRRDGVSAPGGVLPAGGTAAVQGIGDLVAVSQSDDGYGAPVVPAAADGTRSGPATVADGTRSGPPTVAATGWYSRQRDRAAAQRSGAIPPDDAVDLASYEAPDDRFADEARHQEQAAQLEQSTARPQPIGRPQQVILEWSRQPAADASMSGVAPVNAIDGVAAPYGTSAFGGRSYEAGIAPGSPYRPGSIGRSPLGTIYRR